MGSERDGEHTALEEQYKVSLVDSLHALLRWEFGVSASFHFLFVPLSMGLLLCVNVLQTCHLRTGDPVFEGAARFWRRFFLLAWGTGVCTGFPLRWQLEENWGQFGQAAATILKEIFSIEGVIGPFMLAGVLITMIGRRWVGNRFHMSIGWLLLALLGLQAFTILSVNAWMQNPVGVRFDADGWHLQSLVAIVFSATALDKVWHTLSGAMLSGAMFVMALTAALLIRRRHVAMASVSITVGTWVGMLGVISALWSGHVSGVKVAETQPMKFAAFEAHWQHTQEPAPLILFALPDEAHGLNRYELHVPYMLSLLATGSLASPPGILDLTQDNELRLAHALMRPDDPQNKGLLMLYDAVSMREAAQWPTWSRAERIAQTAKATRPAVAPTFWAFRAMVGSGVTLLIVCSVAFVRRKALATGASRRLLWMVQLAAPLPWMAILSGWMVAEMGRQPWTVYGQLPTFHAMLVPDLGHWMVGVLLMFAAALLILALFVLAAWAACRAGPQAYPSWDVGAWRDRSPAQGTRA